MKQELRDLTEGSIGRKMLLYSLPLMISNMLQVLFNMADVAVVGQFAGPHAMGSVGSTTILVSVFTEFLIGMSSGINVLTALHYGAKNKKSLSETVHSALLLSLIIGIVILGCGQFFSKAILILLHTKEELVDGALLYMRIYFIGMPAMAIYNFGNAVYNAAGDTKKPLTFLFIAGAVNVILNLFFVIVCHLDVAGVAIASVVSQYLSAALIIRALLKEQNIYGLRLSELRLTGDKSFAILRIGIPSGIQTAIFQVANLFVQMGVNTFDAVMVEGNSAAMNADTFVYTIMASFYTACASFIGQNYGARKKKRILKSYFVSLAYSFSIGLVIGILLVIFGNNFLGIFTTDSLVIAAGRKRLTIMGFSYGFSAFMDASIAASRALGRSLVPTVVVIMGSVVFRIIWVYTVFAYFMTIPSLYLLYIFSWTLTAAAEMIYFSRIYRKLQV